MSQECVPLFGFFKKRIDGLLDIPDGHNQRLRRQVIGKCLGGLKEKRQIVLNAGTGNGFKGAVIDIRARRVAFEGLSPIGPEGIERGLVHGKFMAREDANRIGRITGALAVRIEHTNRFDFVIK